MPRWTPVLAVVVALVAPALAGCSGSGNDAAAADTPGTVVVRNLRYGPTTITVAAGDTVTWAFDDGRIAHDVKGRPSGGERNAAGFASPVRNKGTWAHRFTTPGTYTYHCSLHPYMKGTVEVR